MTTLTKTLFFACFGSVRRRGRPNEPRLPTRAMKENDRRAVWTTGLTFQLELLGYQEVHDDLKIKEIEEAASDIISGVIGLSKQPRSVELVIAPTRVHVVQNEPWAILHDHPMAVITNMFVPLYDRRLIMYSVTNQDTEMIQIFCFHTDTNTTGLQVFRAMEYALWCWKDRMCTRPPDNRVAELRKAHAVKAQELSCTSVETLQLTNPPAKADETEPSVTPTDSDSAVPASSENAISGDSDSIIATTSLKGIDLHDQVDVIEPSSTSTDVSIVPASSEKAITDGSDSIISTNLLQEIDTDEQTRETTAESLSGPSALQLSKQARHITPATKVTKGELSIFNSMWRRAVERFPRISSLWRSRCKQEGGPPLKINADRVKG